MGHCKGKEKKDAKTAEFQIDYTHGSGPTEVWATYCVPVAVWHSDPVGPFLEWMTIAPTSLEIWLRDQFIETLIPVPGMAGHSVNDSYCYCTERERAGRWLSREESKALSTKILVVCHCFSSMAQLLASAQSWHRVMSLLPKTIKRPLIWYAWEYASISQELRINLLLF